MPLSEDEKAYVLALVHAHVSDADEYVSFVPSHIVRRRIATSATRFAPRQMCVHVGAHYRRKAMYRHLLRALKCTCKFPDISSSIDVRMRAGNCVLRIGAPGPDLFFY